jgi:hypothetical protein
MSGLDGVHCVHAVHFKATNAGRVCRKPGGDDEAEGVPVGLQNAQSERTARPSPEAEATPAEETDLMMPKSPDPPMRPSELQRVQALLADIERAATQLKDLLLNIRARERGKPSEGKTLAEVFADEENGLDG